MATAAEIIYDFDYTELDAERRIVVQQKASEIKSLLRHRAQNAIEIGQKLMEVKEALGYGHYRRWLEAEFTWGKTLANDFENAAKQFADVHNVDNFDSSALRLLASPSVSDQAREEAKALAEGGDRVTHADARSIVAKHKESSGGSASGTQASKKPVPPDRFPVGSQHTVAAGEHQGQQVTVVESDGVTVRCETAAGEVVPLMAAEFDAPEVEAAPKSAPTKSAAPSPIELLSIDLEVAKSRIAYLEGHNDRLERLLRQTVQYLPAHLKRTVRDELKQSQAAAVDD